MIIDTRSFGEELSTASSSAKTIRLMNAHWLSRVAASTVVMAGLGAVLNGTSPSSPVPFGVLYQGGWWWFSFNNNWIAYVSPSWVGGMTGGTWPTAYGEVVDNTGPNTPIGNGIIANAAAAAMNNPFMLRDEGSIAESLYGHGAAPDPVAYNPYPNDIPNYNIGAWSGSGSRTWHYGGA
jgi:hypothetical protein